jgi:iron complex transport system substrate-binding protein
MQFSKYAVRRTLVVMGFAGGFLAASQPGWSQSATHTVTDMLGTSVTVPVTINRIAEQFPAHTVTDIMLGMGDKIVAIPQNVKTIPLLLKIYPGIAKVPELFRNGGSANIEDLLARRPDVISALDGGATTKPFQSAGIPTVVMNFDRMPQLAQSITLAGDVYGGAARERAHAFVDYFNAKLSMIQSRLAKLPADQRPSVVHISSFPPLVIDGGPSLIGDWIKLGGGNDAANEVSGTHVTITPEQLLKWNPDVLIIQTPGGDQGLAANSGQSVIDALAQQPGWQQLKAVKTGRIYIDPQGMYPWDRFGPEEALQIQWTAKTLHPELFTDLDMRSETRKFYKTFFNYTLSDAELNQIFQTSK